jgi:phage FluMu protein Com
MAHHHCQYHLPLHRCLLLGCETAMKNFPQEAVQYINHSACFDCIGVPSEGFYIKLCAWCNKLLSLEPIEGASIISHGICPDCRAKNSQSTKPKSPSPTVN